MTPQSRNIRRTHRGDASRSDGAGDIIGGMTLRLVALTGLLAAFSILAQPLADKPPRLEFEVASLKPNQSGGPGYSIVPRAGENYRPPTSI